ncbi:uncharacterized protein LOC110684447 [Chenopodium quinoa]|uniref:uncharacterized protein LOC110684447 n=1 Tax=Chenopodium quinoa TaxID=63459 RepID=UPI000B78333B|nr:uncharacterized protein LOC110684447 [Chenopodium quinoa]
MEQLAGSLMTHELHLGTNAESSKNKSLALKAQDTNESEVDEDEMAMLVRRFKKMLGNRKYDRNKKFSSSKETTCFKCGLKDHFIRDCPLKENDREKLKGNDQSKDSKAYKPPFSKVPVRGNNMWYSDSGCSKHMIRDKTRFLSLDTYYGETVTFGDNMKEETRKGNTYKVDLNEVPNSSLTCLSVIKDDPLLWHKRFGYAGFSLLDKLISKELVEGLPFIKFLNDKVCHACVRGRPK